MITEGIHELVIGKNKAKVLIDEEDFIKHGLANKAMSISSHGYAVTLKSLGTRTPAGSYQYKRSYLHRLITNAPKHLQVDHINGNRLDNRKDNLRLCVNGSNSRNKGASSGKYKGVHFNKKANKWVAQITKNWKVHHIGIYTDEKDAAKAYNKAAKKMHGKYAHFNIIE